MKDIARCKRRVVEVIDAMHDIEDPADATAVIASALVEYVMESYPREMWPTIRSRVLTGIMKSFREALRT